ncbi:protease SohB [Teredinibacter turnerae]|uniref:protease SohB n=1 Tax=Teredinibacter turnerae TaxID=2426 RepID=UPI00035CD43F|nr:protease SohB [Teredinibacter turnerae]
MEFLYEYGLFFAKALTVVVAFGAVIAIVAAAGMRQQHDSSKGHIEVKKLNEKYEDILEGIKSVVVDENVLKQEQKAAKKAEKAERKKAKADAKKKTAEGDAGLVHKKRVFVTNFDGDIRASETENLREVITSILSLATPQDEVVVRLESQGGMVHSYGLAASQLSRIREKNIPLTVCVDMVAASGGYMMACVADKIVSAPFAILGSIGVVAQLPNFHRLLKKHDVDYEMLTAGEYKRTLTMFGENTDKGRQKFVEDLEDTHTLFKDFIRSNRAVVDVDAVATGEVWFGQRALEAKLVDCIQTSDQYLVDLYSQADVFEIEFVEKKKLAEKLGISIAAAADTVVNRWLGQLNTKFFS